MRPEPLSAEEQAIIDMLKTRGLRVHRTRLAALHTPEGERGVVTIPDFGEIPHHVFLSLRKKKVVQLVERKYAGRDPVWIYEAA